MIYLNITRSKESPLQKTLKISPGHIHHFCFNTISSFFIISCKFIPSGKASRLIHILCSFASSVCIVQECCHPISAVSRISILKMRALIISEETILSHTYLATIVNLLPQKDSSKSRQNKVIRLIRIN